MQAHLRLQVDTRGLSTVEYLIVLCTVALLGFGAWRGFGRAVADQAESAGGSVQMISSVATVGSEGARKSGRDTLTPPTKTVGGALMGGPSVSGSDPTSQSAGGASGALLGGMSANDPDGNRGGSSVSIVEVRGSPAGSSGSTRGFDPARHSSETGAEGGLTSALLESPAVRGALIVLAFRHGAETGASEEAEGTLDSFVQLVRHPIKTGKALGAAIGEIWDDPVAAGKAAWIAVRDGVADNYRNCTGASPLGCGRAFGGVVVGLGTRFIPLGGPLKTVLRRTGRDHDYLRAAEKRMDAQERAYNRRHYGDRYTGPVRPEPGPWMHWRVEETVEAVRRGSAGPSANADEVRDFLLREWRRSEEVGVLTQRLGGRARRAPVAELAPGTPIVAHGLGEHVSRSSFIQNVREWRRNPLRDADGNAVPVPTWMEVMRTGDRNGAMPNSWVNVGVLNPHIAAGLGRSGPPDVYAQAVHNLADQRRAISIAEARARLGPNASGIENAQIEQIANRINRMRRPGRSESPVPFDEIEARLVAEARDQRLNNAVESTIRAGVRAQRKLELEP